MKVFVLVVVLVPLFFCILRSSRARAWAEAHGDRICQGWRLLCGLLTAAVVLCGLVTVVTERIRFYEEATILSTVAAFWHGQPLYTDVQAPAEYSLLYGPVTYFAYLPSLLAGAERLEGYEAWALAGLAATFALIFAALRPRFGSSVALGSMALVAAIVARVTDNVWAIKADVWILMFSALGLWAALRLRPWLAACVMALSGAMLVDLKATLLLVALLPLVLLWQFEGAARMSALAGAVFLPMLVLLPFALPRVSLRNYFALLVEYKGRATSIAMLKINAEITLLILLPLLALLVAAIQADVSGTKEWLRGRAVYLLVFAAACVVAAVSGAKTGGGPWHCVVLVIPCLPLNAELWRIAGQGGARSFLQTQGWGMASVLGVACALFLTGLSALATGVKERLHDPPGDTPVSMRAVESDLLALSQRYAGRTMQMGYSDRAHYNLTYVRPALQIRGNPLFIDANTRNEADVVRKPVPETVLQALARCDIQIWLIPKGGEPFSMESPYFMDPLADRKSMERDLYPEVFRQTFRAHYRLMQQQESQYFNLWECRAAQ